MKPNIAKSKNLFGKQTSIILNTYNRPKLLLKTCKLLDELNFGGQLIICDASEGDTQKDIKKNVNKLKLSYSLDYKNIPKNGNSITLSMNKCFKAGLEVINKPFTILTFEDDIPFPSTLNKFENFLNKNKDFNACMGRLIWYNYDENNNSKNSLIGTIQNFKRFLIGERVGESISGSDLIDDKSIQRIQNFIKNPAHYIFAFQRSKNMSDIIAPNFEEFDIDHGHFSTEYYYWFVTLIRGKLKHFREFYILRTCHNLNLSHPHRNDKVHLPILDKLIEDNWSKNLNLFRNNLSSILKKYDPALSDEEIEKCNNDYIKFYIKHRIGNYFYDNFKERVKNIVDYTFSTRIKIKYEIIFQKLRFYLKLSNIIFKINKNF